MGRGSRTPHEERAVAELAGREKIVAAQRRLATLVSGGAPAAEVFAAIAEQVGDVIGLPLVVVWRYDSDGMGTVVGAWCELAHPFEVGSRWPLDGGALCALLSTTGRPGRIDDLTAADGAIADAQRGSGMRACAGAPILVDGGVWGAISVLSTASTALPQQIEYRLAEITELVASAISNIASREELARLAEEQSALRRVATLVARAVPEEQLFATVAEEVGRLFGADLAGLIRYEDDLSITPVAGWGAVGAHPPWPDPWPADEADPATMMAKTRQPVRIDWQGVPGPIAGMLRDAGIRSSVGSPVLVDGRLWGAFALHSSDSNPFPLDSESRLEAFAELIAIAISNIEARAELAASRARIVEAADGERRRVVRDLHDGAQQRLVHTIVTVKRGQLALDNGSESETRALLAEALDHAQQATQELRELAHGLLPAVLAYGGLRAAVQELASRTPLPVETRIFADRLPARVEATAYFVIAEALTNIAKHSGARRATIRGSVERSTVYLEVRDDGVGGARPDGSGLLGLADRLGALGGRLRIESPSHGGTLIACELPLPTSARGGSAPAHGPGAEPPVPRQRPRGAGHDSSVTARAQSASGVWRGRAR
ncbi:MAG TPA: GAF domain-containing protein [Solirubrobacteraceae bacterium]|jgi:signal transduction histidine kinase